MRAILSILLCATSALAYPLDWTLNWPAPTDPRVTGFRVYRLQGTNWIKYAETTNTSLVIGQGCYSVTALAKENESSLGQVVCTLDAISNLCISATLTLTLTNK